jgi:hypothetical protein
MSLSAFSSLGNVATQQSVSSPYSINALNLSNQTLLYSNPCTTPPSDITGIVGASGATPFLILSPDNSSFQSVPSGASTVHAYFNLASQPGSTITTIMDKTILFDINGTGLGFIFGGNSTLSGAAAVDTSNPGSGNSTSTTPSMGIIRRCSYALRPQSAVITQYVSVNNWRDNLLASYYTNPLPTINTTANGWCTVIISTKTSSVNGFRIAYQYENSSTFVVNSGQQLSTSISQVNQNPAFLTSNSTWAGLSSVDLPLIIPQTVGANSYVNTFIGFHQFTASATNIRNIRVYDGALLYNL